MAYEFEWLDKGTIVRFTGKLSIEEINEANGILHGDSRLDGHDFTIWDFLEADMSSITVREMLQPAATDQAASLSVPRMHVVVLVKEPSAVKLIQHYVESAQSLGNPWRFHIAESMDDALVWLNS